MDQEDLYEILGVAHDATEQQVRAACRRILTQVHPDHGGSDALFRVVYRAYSVLTDPARRADYDASLRAAGPSSTGTSRGPDAATADEGAPGAGPAPGAGGADGDRGAHEAAAGPDGAGAGGASEWAPPLCPQGGGAGGAPVRGSLGPRGTISVAQHPSLAVFVVAFALLGAAAVAHLHDLASFGLAVSVLALVGQAGHRRALRAERARRARIGDVEAMGTGDFEDHLVAVFRRDGFAVRAVPAETGAVRLLLKKADRITAVTAERAGVVEADVVEDAASARARHRAGEALVVTTGAFSAEAVEVAGRRRVQTMGRNELSDLLASQAAAPLPRGSALLARELQHGIPAVIEGVSAVLRGLVSLLEDLGEAWEAGTAPADEVGPLSCEAAPPGEDAAAS